MAYGRKIRGGVPILPTIAGSGFGGSGLRSIRSKRSKKRTHTVKRKSKHNRRSSPKRARRSTRGIKYTKNGQPYRILANGRARFIKGKRRK